MTEDKLREEILEKMQTGNGTIADLVMLLAVDHRNAHIQYLKRHDISSAILPPHENIYAATEYMCNAQSLQLPWHSTAEDKRSITLMRKLYEGFMHVISTLNPY